MNQFFIKKIALFFLLFLIPFFLISQTQIGDNINGEETVDWSGEAVSLSSDGSIVAIGARLNDGNGQDSGHVRVYKNNNGNWEQIGSDINGEAIGDYSGYSISLSSDGSIIAIGAFKNSENGYNSGHVRIYKNNNGNWIQEGDDIDGEAVEDGSGLSVSLSSDGSIVAIGASLNNGNGVNSGHVRIYKNNNGNWIQEGDDIDGEAVEDSSGYSVSLSSDGNILAIGAPYNDGNGVNSGHVRIYKYNNGNWEQLGVDINGEAVSDESGRSISLSSDGSILAIGAIRNIENGSNSGHVRIYKYNNGNWEQIGDDINGEASLDFSGNSISLSSDGSIVAIGAYSNNGNGVNSGHVRIYKNKNDNWEQVGIDIDGETEGDESGKSVCLSSDGSIVAIGANLNDGNGSNSGHVRVFDLSIVLKTTNYLEVEFNIFPNPTNNVLTIQLKNESQLKKVNLYNNLGKLIISSKKQTINTSNLSKGIYFLQVETEAGKASKKLIIE